MSYGAVSHVFNNNKSTVYNKYLLTETHIKQGYISII